SASASVSKPAKFARPRPAPLVSSGRSRAFATAFESSTSKERSMIKIRPLAVRVSPLILALLLVCYLAQARFPQPKQEYQARHGKHRTQADGPVLLFGYTSRR